MSDAEVVIPICMLASIAASGMVRLVAALLFPSIRHSVACHRAAHACWFAASGVALLILLRLFFPTRELIRLSSTSRAKSEPPTATAGQAEATSAASELSLGMREEDAEKILAMNGLTAAFKAGCSHGWTCVYILSNHCALALDIAPTQARADGSWTGGLLRAANIQSNGVTVVPIILGNAR
jgi:hypothetical protein